MIRLLLTPILLLTAMPALASCPVIKDYLKKANEYTEIGKRGYASTTKEEDCSVLKDGSRVSYELAELVSRIIYMCADSEGNDFVKTMSNRRDKHLNSADNQQESYNSYCL